LTWRNCARNADLAHSNRSSASASPSRQVCSRSHSASAQSATPGAPSSCGYAVSASSRDYGEARPLSVSRGHSLRLPLSADVWPCGSCRRTRVDEHCSNQAYESTLRQEPEFADRSAGDIVSRLSIDTSILGDSVTSNLSDGLRWVACTPSWLRLHRADESGHRAAISASVGGERGSENSLVLYLCGVVVTRPVTHQCSRGDVLDLVKVDAGDAVCRSTDLSRRCKSWTT
jgi:hypothetical protein